LCIFILIGGYGFNVIFWLVVKYCDEINLDVFFVVILKVLCVFIEWCEEIGCDLVMFVVLISVLLSFVWWGIVVHG